MRNSLGNFRNLYFLLLLLSTTSFGQTNGFCGLENKVINNGEKLYYKVYYNASFVWVAAGEVTFTTQLSQVKGRAAYHVVGHGTSFKSYDWFFKVRDTYETWIDVNSLLPLKFKRDVLEGDYTFKNDVDFDRQSNMAASSTKTIPIGQCTQDVLSAVYYARNIDYSKYKPGEKINFDIFLDNQVYHVYIRYLGKEVVKTKYGKFNSIKISPLLVAGNLFKGGEGMTVWVSDDKNQVPLRVSSSIVVGSVKADLMHFENIKYPLTSLIKKK